MKIHIVQKKDTLQSVIEMYRVSKEEIERENPHLAAIQFDISLCPLFRSYFYLSS